MGDDVDIHNRPPEMEGHFLEDIAGIVASMEDDNDHIMLDAVKNLVEAYMRSDMSAKRFEKVYNELKGVYSEKKGKSQNKDLVTHVDNLIVHAKELKGKIDYETNKYFV
jgi:adenosyl cobinamide kinase/adenosyl cobinamide phosphate guanylyltransferase